MRLAVADYDEAAAAGAALVEPELDPVEDFSELDFSDDDEVLVDSELVADPLVVLLADSRLSVR
jgi:hypothetical protein